jgi:hypothetical protein
LVTFSAMIQEDAWIAAMLDGLVKETVAVFEPKSCCPGRFWEEAAAAKQHRLVADTRKSVLSIINDGARIALSVEADPIQGFLGQDRRNLALFDCKPPKPRIEAVRVVDMNASNCWAAPPSPTTLRSAPRRYSKHSQIYS